MKNLFKGLFIVALLFILASCSQTEDETTYSVQFEEESLETIVASENTEIILPFVESETGFFLGWEDAEGTVFEETYIVEEDVTLTPVFESFDEVLELTYDDQSGTVKIDEYQGEARIIKIPYLIDGYYVNAIGYQAFFNASAERVDVPMSVLEIGRFAFAGMPNLEAFHYYGDDLGVTYREMNSIDVHEIIDEYEACSLDDKDGIPTTENPWEFEEGCPIIEITDSTEDNAVPGPGGELNFDYALLFDLSYGSPGVQLYENAFYQSFNIKTITLHSHFNSNLYPGQVRFESLTNLEAIYIEDHSSLYSDGGILFSKDNDALWYYPIGLLEEEMVFSEAITRIGFGALNGDKVRTITLHDNLTLDTGAFMNLTSLVSITVDDAHPSLMDVDGVVFSKDGSELLVYPAGNRSTTYVTPDNTEIIQQYSFINQAYLEHLVISEGVERIERRALRNAQSLHTVDIASTVEYIDSGALAGIGSLETVIIRNTNVKFDYIAMRDHRYSHDGPFTIYVADNLLDDYIADPAWEEYEAYFAPLSELDE